VRSVGQRLHTPDAGGTGDIMRHQDALVHCLDTKFFLLMSSLSHVLSCSHQFFPNAGSAVSYPVLNCCPSPQVPVELRPISSEIISLAAKF